MLNTDIDQHIKNNEHNHIANNKNLIYYHMLLPLRMYKFKEIQTIPPAKQLVDIVLSRTQRKTPTVARPALQRSENNLAICFLLEIPLRPSPFQMKVTDKYRMPKTIQLIMICLWGSQAGDTSQTSCPKRPEDGS